MSKTNTRNLFFGALLVAALFVIYPYAKETVTSKSAVEFEVVLQDSSLADVLIITTQPYKNVDWEHMKKVVAIEARHSSNTGYLGGHTTQLLNDEDFSIAVIFITKRVTTVLIKPTME